MKNRCLRRPFVRESWCLRDTTCDAISYTVDSFLTSLLHNYDLNVCQECINKLYTQLYLRKNIIKEKLNEQE